ncbi:MAG: carotenoid biosynthesis protein [Gemmatimonadaceae bacterium]
MPTTGPEARGRAVAAASATGLIWLHAALILFSTAALVTFLANPSAETQAWLAREPNATIYRVAWKFSGPTYVVAGFLAAVAHAMSRLGVRPRVALMFVTVSLLALASELLGTHTGYPFGGYSYTEMLGHRILGLVPFPIPISWTCILYCSLAMCGRLLPARDDIATRLRWSAGGALILTAWDVAMDPAMVKTFHWVWAEPGAFYGMPYTNWLGWLATGFVLSWVMLRFVPPTHFAERVSPTRLPLALYGLNGIMPIAICLRHGMFWAAGLGMLAMGLPLLLSLRRPDRVTSERATGSAWRGEEPASLPS